MNQRNLNLGLELRLTQIKLETWHGIVITIRKDFFTNS